MAFRFRTSFQKLVPRWLSNGDGGKVLFVINWFIDSSLERAQQSLTCRFPSFAGESALAKIGDDRGIPRGRDEAQAHYVKRLKAWRFPRGHRVRGNAFALLEQVSEYWGGIFCRTIDDSGNQFTRDASGGEFALQGATWNWDGAYPAKWSRFWILMQPRPELRTITSWGTFADLPAEWGTFGAAKAAGYTIGQKGASVGDIRAMFRLFHPIGHDRAWKPAGTRAMFYIVDLGENPTAIVPAGAWGTPAGRLTAPSVLRFWRIT